MFVPRRVHPSISSRVASSFDTLFPGVTEMPSTQDILDTCHTTLDTMLNEKKECSGPARKCPPQLSLETAQSYRMPFREALPDVLPNSIFSQPNYLDPFALEFPPCTGSLTLGSLMTLDGFIVPDPQVIPGCDTTCQEISGTM